MTSRNRGRTRDYKSNREANDNEEYPIDYIGDETLRRNFFENEKQNLVSRIIELESRNKAEEWKKTALIVSITILFIATVSVTIIHQLSIEQLNIKILNTDQSFIEKISELYQLGRFGGWKVC